MIQTAIVGCGQVASDHVAAIRRLEDVRICAVADPNPHRRLDVAARVGDVPAYPDVSSMLDNERPDAVHVLTPPATHEAVAVEAMRAGCHVLVEKPIALDVGAVDRMIAIANDHGVVLSTCHNMLFKPSVLKARRLVEADAVGRVVHVVGFYGVAEDRGYSGMAGSHWAYRLPGGIFTNFLPHMISLQQAFLGPDATVVAAVVHHDPEDKRKHGELVVLSETSQASGVMTISVGAKPDTKFVEVYGTKGTVRVDLVREICILQQAPRVPRPLAKVFLGFDHARQLLTGTTRSALMVASKRLQGNPGLLLLVGDFYASIQGDIEATTPSAEDGRAMVETLESIWSNGPELTRPVTSPTPPKRPRTDVERSVSSSGSLGKALVTGATGFLGSHLVAALSRCDVEVAALVRDPSRTPLDVEERAQLVVGDLESQDSLDYAMKDVDVVYHCAAATTSRAPWEVHNRDTVLGTKRLLASAYRCGAPRVVHVSSVVVYGLASSPLEGVDESFPWRDDGDPWAYYQRAKIEAEKWAFHYAHVLGLPVVVVRPGILYGPRRPIRTGFGNLGSLVFSPGRGRNRLPFTYIDNVVDCLLLAASSPHAVGQAFNVVDEPQVSRRTVLAASHDRTVLVPVPPTLLRAASAVARRAGGHVEGGRPPSISDFAIHSACRDITYSTAKAREVLGWQQGVSFEDGLRLSQKPG